MDRRTYKNRQEEIIVFLIEDNRQTPIGITRDERGGLNWGTSDWKGSPHAIFINNPNVFRNFASYIPDFSSIILYLKSPVWAS